MKYNKRAYVKMILPSKDVRVGDYISTGKRNDEVIVEKTYIKGGYKFHIDIEGEGNGILGVGYVMDMHAKAKMHILRFSLKDLLNEI